MKTIIFVGIPGVGKSSILKEVATHVPIHVMNYGDKMLEAAALEGITRDTLRKMPFRVQQQIGVKAAQNMVQEKIDGVVIIDTHALVRINTGFCPGLPREVLEILSPLAYALVECDPAIILERRLKDSGRVRDLETKEALLKHQELTRSFVTACCMYTGSLLCCIENNMPVIGENAKDLIKLCQSV